MYKWLQMWESTWHTHIHPSQVYRAVLSMSMLILETLQTWRRWKCSVTEVKGSEYLLGLMESQTNVVCIRLRVNNEHRNAHVRTMCIVLSRSMHNFNWACALFDSWSIDWRLANEPRLLGNFEFERTSHCMQYAYFSCTDWETSTNKCLWFFASYST